MIKTILASILFVMTTVGVVYGIHKYLSYLQRTDSLALYESQKPKAIVSRSKGKTVMLAKNVNFRFTPKINLRINSLKAQVSSTTANTVLNFDDIHALHIHILKGEALLHVDVMKYIFKDKIFNYEGSPLKLEDIVLLPSDDSGKSRVRLKGELKFVIWLKFEMLGELFLDKENGKIVIAASEIKALYNPYTKGLLGLIGLNLEKLLPVPKGRGVRMQKNRIIVSPYSLFPPPKLSGKIESLRVKGDSLLLKFTSKTDVSLPAMPSPSAKNYLFVSYGDLKFGKLIMVDAALQMVDNDPKDLFDFYLKDYHRVLTSGGSAIIQRNRSVLVQMPDYDDVTVKK